MRFATLFAFVLFFLTVGYNACHKTKVEDIVQESATEQVGDVMSSVDDMSLGNEGAFAKMNLSPRPGVWEQIFVSEAQALTSCILERPSDCAEGVKVRHFSGCTLGAFNFTGAVEFKYSDSACQLKVGGSLTRKPNFTMIKKQPAVSYEVSTSSDGGQKLEMTGDGFVFSSAGIRRKVSAYGNLIADFTTSTTSGITIVPGPGRGRAGRMMNGGSLTVINNLNSQSCEYIPVNLKWEGACNCPTSGVWEESCADGRKRTLSLNGCGMGVAASANGNRTIVFDQCRGI